MTDDRLRYAPYPEGGTSCILLTVTTPHGEAGTDKIMADGESFRDAAEAMVSKLIDTFEWVWEEWDAARLERDEARRIANEHLDDSIQERGRLYQEGYAAGQQSIEEQFDEALAFAAHMRLTMRSISRWDVLNPPDTGLVADAVWLKQTIDDALSLTPPDALAAQQGRVALLEDVAAAVETLYDLLMVYAQERGGPWVELCDARERLTALGEGGGTDE